MTYLVFIHKNLLKLWDWFCILLSAKPVKYLWLRLSFTSPLGVAKLVLKYYQIHKLNLSVRKYNFSQYQIGQNTYIIYLHNNYTFNNIAITLQFSRLGGGYKPVEINRSAKSDWRNCMASYIVCGRVLSCWNQVLTSLRSRNVIKSVMIHLYVSALGWRFANENGTPYTHFQWMRACFLVHVRVCGWLYSIILCFYVTTQTKPYLVGEKNVIENTVTIVNKAYESSDRSVVFY